MLAANSYQQVASTPFTLGIGNKIRESKEYFLSDEYLDKVITEQKWSEHGSHLDEADVLFESLGLNYQEALKHPETLKIALRGWLPIRINYIINELEYELAHSKTIYRAMSFKAANYGSFPPLVKSAKHVSDLGVYWSTSANCEPWGSSIIDTDVTVCLSMELDLDSINIIETVRSRIDYKLGDDEQEINLFPRSKLNKVTVKPL